MTWVRLIDLARPRSESYDLDPPLRPPGPSPRTASERAISDLRVLRLVRPPSVRSPTSGFSASHDLQDESVQGASRQHPGHHEVNDPQSDRSTMSAPKIREIGHLTSVATEIGHLTSDRSATSSPKVRKHGQL